MNTFVKDAVAANYPDKQNRTERIRTERHIQGRQAGQKEQIRKSRMDMPGEDGFFISKGCCKKGCFVIRYEYFNVVYFISFQLMLREGCKLL